MARILVIEHDVKIGEDIERRLKSAGHKLKTAPNVASALKLIFVNGEILWDIIVSDNALGGTRPNGFELLHQMQKYVLAKRVRFVLITNLAQLPNGSDARKEAAHRGAVCIFKSRVPELPDIVSRVLALK